MAKKGHIPWNKGLKTGIVPKTAFKTGNPAPVTAFKKGHISWSASQKGITLNTGRTHFKKGQTMGEKNAKWKGDSVGYVSLHTWIYRMVGRPVKCLFCGEKNKKLHWANIDHEYRRNLEDFIELCVSCHKRYDLFINSNKKQLWLV